MIEQLVKDLAGQGLLGVLLVIVGAGYFRKDKKVSDLQDKRLEDIKEVGNDYTKLIIDINSTLDKLITLIEGGRKINEDRK